MRNEQDGSLNAGGGSSPGGDPVCWLSRVCPECGLLVEGALPAVCERCGTTVSEDE